MTLKELRAKLASVRSEMSTLHGEAEGRTFTEEEETKWAELKASRDSLQSQIEREEELLEDRTAEVDREIRTEDDGDDDADSDGTGREVRAEVNDPKDFRSFGEFLYHCFRAERYHEIDPRLKQAGTEKRAATGMGESIGADGGFFVQTDQQQEIMSHVFNPNAVAGRVNRIGIGPNANGLELLVNSETSRANGSRWGGVRAYWTAEGGALTATDPEFDKIELKLKKLTALAYATDELMQDWSALGSVLSQAFTEELQFKIEDAIINGTGGGQPVGILNADATISVAAETGQAATTILFENIVNMYARAYARGRGNSVWLINQDIEPQLFTMSMAVGTGGVPVYLPANGVADSPFGSLMGRPVIPIEFAPTLGTVGDIMLCDLSQYILIDKGGFQTASSIHVRFTNDELTFRWVTRLDGASMWKSALTPYQGTNTQSPFIALATRS